MHLTSFTYYVCARLHMHSSNPWYTLQIQH